MDFYKTNLFLGICFITCFFLLVFLVLFSGQSINNFFASSFLLNNSSIGEENIFCSDVSVFFCPEDFCSFQLIENIDLADEYVFVAVYSFTHKDIADALVRAKNRGVDVRVVIDFLQSSSQYSLADFLLSEGIQTVVKKGAGSMHNKFVVIDGEVVFTGSFNFSSNADNKNDENLVLIKNKMVAKEFLAEFNELFFLIE